MSSEQEILRINNWETGIAKSPNKGFGMFKKADIDEFAGSVTVQKKVASYFHAALAVTFTADAGTDVCTIASGTAPNTGTAVVLTTTGTLPAGLSLATNYFVIYVSATTFKLATTITNADAGTQIDITDAGSGVHTVTTVNPGTIRHFVNDERTSTVFCSDSNGRVWFTSSNVFMLLNGNTLTSSSGLGLAILRTSDDSATYLFSFRNAKIDVINVYGVSDKKTPSWTNGWQTLNTSAGTSNSHHAIRGQDNIIYYCDARYVGSIREIPSTVFDPANSATYTFSVRALDLPNDEIANWLEELGDNLLVGGLTTNKIYPWNRVDDSYNLPLAVPEIGIYRLKNLGGNVYICAGKLGNIYVSQGSYVREFVSLPAYVINPNGSLDQNVITWGGVSEKRGSLLVGVGTIGNENSGVYKIYQDGRITIDNVPSTGTTNATALFAPDDYYYVGYSGGADRVSGVRYSDYSTIVHSAFYQVATKTQKGTFSKLDMVLSRAATGGSVRVSYRTQTSGSFTTIATFTADSTNNTFQEDNIGLVDLENIQIQIELSDSAVGSVDIELVELRLIP